jgi:hypothetical protein
MVSIVDLRRPEISLHWHEAVAVVAEVAATLSTLGLSSVPRLDSIVLAVDGTLRMPDDGPLDPEPVRWLADMLEVLVAPVACPPELRRLIADSVTHPPAFATLEAFAEALAFFERPGRRELLRALAGRVSDATSASHADVEVELERLEARARNQPERPAPREASIPPRVRRFVLVASIVVIVMAGSIAGAFLAFTGSTARAAAVTEGLRARASQISHLTQKGLEAIGVHLDAAPAPAPPSSAAVEKPAPVARKPARRSARDLPATISVKELQRWSTPVLTAPAMPVLSERLDLRDDTIYADGAVGVEPAVLMRPALPSEPPTTASVDEIGVLEILVSATGIVEHVRLISTANRFHDRMIVAAAKAWSFEPATKNGHPVRYRTRVRVTL